MKYKYMLFGSLITVIVLTLSLLILNISESSNTISVKTINDYTDITNDLKDNIKKVKDEDCKKSLNEMLKRIDDTYFLNNISQEQYVNSYFLNDYTVIDYYNNVLDSCQLTNKSLDYIYVDLLASLNFPNRIKDEYSNRYELRIKDIFNKPNYQHQEIGTYTTKVLELKAFKNLVKEVVE